MNDIKMIQLLHGDCLELMKEIPNKSVDMILCDLPYGTTQCKWDNLIPFTPLWEQYERVIKDNGAIVLFSAQPFTTDLINSNRKLFRYEIIWEKTTKSGFLDAKKKPLKCHEVICIFYKHRPTYNPIMTKVKTSQLGKNKKASKAMEQYRTDLKTPYYTDTGERYPTDIIKFSSWNGALFGKTDKATKHPTQKPVPLLEYLIKTYTNEGDTVLDNCMGSGSTGVACVNLNRNFIGIELKQEYFDIANERINHARLNVMPEMKDSEDAFHVGRMVGQMQRQLEIELSLEVEKEQVREVNADEDSD